MELLFMPKLIDSAFLQTIKQSNFRTIQALELKMESLTTKVEKIQAEMSKSRKELNRKIGWLGNSFRSKQMQADKIEEYL